MNQVAILLIVIVFVFLFFWLLLGNAGGASGPTFYPVNEQQVQELQLIFPNIEEDAIRFDLSKTGSLQATTENILRLGTALPRPPTEIIPLNRQGTTASPQGTMISSNSVTQDSSKSEGVSLVSRFDLKNHSDNAQILEKPAHKWVADPEERAEILRKQKEYMILSARKKFLEKESKQS